jgi:RNA polymerase sigma-70 factor, ECF subfamily
VKNRPSDIADLISRTALRDRTAFARLYRDSSPKLFAVALRILKDSAEAEDALQEIYVKIWGRADRFAGNGTNPMAWLVAIARNHSIDVIRSRRAATSDIDDHIDLADPAKSPEAEAVAASDRGRLDNCLDQLESAKADSVRSAYMEGYSYHELAKRHRIPLNTMRTWLRRSLMKLKDCLEE